MSALREELRRLNLYAESLRDSDVVLINSFHRGQEAVVAEVIREKVRRPSLRIVHRVDGPFSKVRGRNDFADIAVSTLNRLLADGTVFQSEWSKGECLKQGLDATKPSYVIGNAPQPNLFFPKSDQAVNAPRLRLIATSWSSNQNKGYEVYTWMDKNVDWDLYEMTFVGNPPVAFKNIKALTPLDSWMLAEEIRSHDVYVSAARNEPCSNAIIEGLCCGLPVLGYDGGGTPELVKQGGLLFSNPAEIPPLLNELRAKYATFQRAIRAPSLEEITTLYVSFARKITDKQPMPPPGWIKRTFFSIVYLSWASKLAAQRLVATLDRLK